MFGNYMFFLGTHQLICEIHPQHCYNSGSPKCFTPQGCCLELVRRVSTQFQQGKGDLNLIGYPDALQPSSTHSVGSRQHLHMALEQ